MPSWSGRFSLSRNLRTPVFTPKRIFPDGPSNSNQPAQFSILTPQFAGWLHGVMYTAEIDLTVRHTAEIDLAVFCTPHRLSPQSDAYGGDFNLPPSPHPQLKWIVMLCGGMGSRKPLMLQIEGKGCKKDAKIVQRWERNCRRIGPTTARIEKRIFQPNQNSLILWFLYLYCHTKPLKTVKRQGGSKSENIEAMYIEEMIIP